MTKLPAIDQVARIMRETADKVIMPRFQALGDTDVREKTGPKDLVTIADIESERRMTPLLRALMPGSVAIGEEAAAEDPTIFRHLEEQAPVWIIDPVDGTSNFAKGGRNFCVMVGLVIGGETVLGVILDPLGARWVGAEKGAGAWLHDYDDTPIDRLSVRAAGPLDSMRGALNFRFFESPLREEMRARANEAVGEHYRLGCAGHEYLRLVTGHSHFTMYLKNMPWDHVPGCLIHAEAGGYQARFDGRAYRAHELTGGLIAAPDRESWKALRDSLFGSGVAAPD